MNYILIIIWLFNLFTYFKPEYYISELALSFLPYILFFCIIITFYNIFTIRKIIPKDEKKHKKIIRLWNFILYFLLFVFYSQKYLHFYTFQWFQASSETGINVFYANIYKDNTDFTWLENTIKSKNPDVIMLVEFADLHYQNLKDYLSENYPYVNRTSRSQEFIWSIVFSKIPLENLIENYPQWMRRYWYFSINFQWKKYYFYLVHTSSPTSYENFKMRNEQLLKLSSDFDLHEKNREIWHNVIMIWDFNISPRSEYYKNFYSDLDLQNYTQNAWWLFTRKFKYFPIFWSHIDHIFINSWVEIWNLKTINILWSDHRGYSFTISN